jgi:hypothetical protein
LPDATVLGIENDKDVARTAHRQELPWFNPLMRLLLGYVLAIRLHISLDDALIEELDRRVGPRDRSRYIAAALRRALEDAARWDDIEAGVGAIAPHGHEWDDDPAAWVAAQRASDSLRSG